MAIRWLVLALPLSPLPPLAASLGIYNALVQPNDETVGLSKPLAWIHVPKTGSSFANALVHTPGLCPRMPKDFAMDLDHCPPGNVMGCPRLNNITLSEDCPGAFSTWGSPDFTKSWHVGVGDVFEDKNFHGIMFMRQPEQRMLSHFYFGSPPHGEKELELFKNHMEGCAVKMMVHEQKRSWSFLAVHVGSSPAEPGGGKRGGGQDQQVEFCWHH